MELAAEPAMIQWNIGCSGYAYPEWRGLFYPAELPKVKWFEFYCRHFNTIELNTTFYRFPKVQFLSNWYQRSPKDFSFSIKAPRLITHFNRFKDAQKYLTDFYSNVQAGLKEKAACILFQFPANYVYDKEHLDTIISLLHPEFNNAVEFRNQSWWNETVFTKLTENRIAFSGMSHPSLPDTVIQTSSTIYFRFHGVPGLYISAYQTEQLEKIARAIQSLPSIEKAFIYFNNTAEGAALSNAKQFQEIGEYVH